MYFYKYEVKQAFLLWFDNVIKENLRNLWINSSVINSDELIVLWNREECIDIHRCIRLERHKELSLVAMCVICNELQAPCKVWLPI